MILLLLLLTLVQRFTCFPFESKVEEKEVNFQVGSLKLNLNLSLDVALYCFGIGNVHTAY
ncbi:MAG: hypothetical protein ACKVOU_00365 [Cytophagales bacterium]